MTSYANKKIRQLDRLKCDVTHRSDELTRLEKNVIVTAIDDVRDRFLQSLPEENLLNNNE